MFVVTTTSYFFQKFLHSRGNEISHRPEEVFDIDEEALEQKFKALQWQLHPDRYTTANAIEQSYSTDQAALVNEAYKVLKDPLLRAEYMVRIVVL